MSQQQQGGFERKYAESPMTNRRNIQSTSPISATHPMPPMTNMHDIQSTFPVSATHPMCPMTNRHGIQPMSPISTTQRQTFPSPISVMATNQQRSMHSSSPTDTIQQNYSFMYTMAAREQNAPYSVPHSTTYPMSLHHPYVLPPSQQNGPRAVPLSTQYPQNYHHPTTSAEAIQQSWSHSLPHMDSREQTSRHSIHPTTAYPQKFTYSVPPTAPHNQTFSHPALVIPPPQQNAQRPIHHTAYQQSYPYPTSFTENYPYPIPHMAMCAQNVQYSVPPAISHQQHFVYPTYGQTSYWNYSTSIPQWKSQELHFGQMPQSYDSIFGGELSPGGTQPGCVNELEEVKSEEREFINNPESELHFEKSIKHLRSKINSAQALLIVTQMRQPDAKETINCIQRKLYELQGIIRGNPRYSSLEELIWDRTEEHGILLTKDDVDDMLTTLQSWCYIDVAKIVTQYLPSEQNILRALEEQFDEFVTSGTDQSKEEYEFLLAEICKTNDYEFEMKATVIIGRHTSTNRHIFRKVMHCWRPLFIRAMNVEEHVAKIV